MLINGWNDNVLDISRLQTIFLYVLVFQDENMRVFKMGKLLITTPIDAFRYVCEEYGLISFHETKYLSSLLEVQVCNETVLPYLYHHRSHISIVLMQRCICFHSAIYTKTTHPSLNNSSQWYSSLAGHCSYGLKNKFTWSCL